MNRQAICGVDFGTSNSTFGILTDQGPKLIALEKDEVTLPSALFFDFEDHHVHYGRDAIATYLEGGEGRMMRALKSILGTPTIHEATMIGNERKPFTAVLGLFLKHMKAKAEAEAGIELTHVVMGRPVHFIDHNPDADGEAQQTLQDIAYSAGFSHVEFEFEPVAAARDFQRQAKREEIALIIDLGGGTSDFTILKIEPTTNADAVNAQSGQDNSTILANAGVHIGGTDFDRWLSLARVMPLLGYQSPMTKEGRLMPVGFYHDLATWQKINFLYDHKTRADLRYLRREAKQPHLIDRLIELLDLREGHHLALQVEAGKIALSDLEETVVALDFVEKGLHADMTRADLVASLEDGVEQIQKTVLGACQQAQIAASDITAVFLTGGSTKVPYIRNSLTSLTPNAQILDGDAFGSVGLGLALEAQKRFL